MLVKVTNQQPTVLFSIYQNNTWTIRSLVDETIKPGTQHIILKIVGFLESGRMVNFVRSEHVFYESGDNMCGWPQNALVQSKVVV